MRWSRVKCCLFGLGYVLALASCGSSGFDSGGGTDALTMTFVEFNGDNITQQDSVGTTSADVDICQSICDTNVGGIIGNTAFETFTQTVANAVFVNNGTADILLDRYSVTVQNAAHDLPTVTTETSVLLPGGRCSNSPSQHCGSDADCGLGTGIINTCEHVEVPVEILLFSFSFKEAIVAAQDGVCPGVDPVTGLPTPGRNIVPITLQTNVVFSGSDQSGERFTVSTGLVAGFFDANNCTTGNGG